MNNYTSPFSRSSFDRRFAGSSLALLALAFVGCGMESGTEAGEAGASAAELRKGVMGATNGDSDYCDDPTHRCDIGEGDCDSTSQCTLTNVCAPNRGSRYGLGAGVDVCVPATCVNGVRDGGELNVDCGGTSACGACVNVRYTKGVPGASNGDPDFCGDPTNLCTIGEGDCDSNAQCAGGLVCRFYAGLRFGLPYATDVCVPPACNNYVKDTNEAGVDCGGTSGCGACNGQKQTKGSMGATNPNPDFCDDPMNLCVAGEGDCDSNAQCGGGSVCAIGRGAAFGFDPWIDVCVNATCTNGMLDAGEAGIDCGGTSGCGACAATCMDGVQNGLEVGVDCGGSCAPCVCVPNSVAYCYSGPPGTAGVGICTSSTKTCNSVGSGYGACGAEVTPAAEDCTTPQDENCDGFVLPCTATDTFFRRAGDAAAQDGRAMAVDGSGNIYLAGSFAGTINFGGTPLVSSGGNDIYLVKLDPTGAHLWSSRFGDDRNQLALGLAVTPAGDVAITGTFLGTVDFGVGTHTAGGTQQDMFIATFDTAGDCQWSQQFGDAAGHQQGIDVKFDNAGNVIVTGIYRSTVNFGGGALPTAGDWNVFLVKLDGATSAHLWSAGYGDSAPQAFPRGLAVDGSNNVFVTGSFNGGIDFGGGTLSSAGGTDIFVARFNSAGAHLNSASYGDAADQQGRRIAVDEDGRVALLGYGAGTVDFGCGGMTTAGDNDIYLAQLNGSLVCAWSQIFGTSFGQYADALAVDDADQIIIGGEFENDVDFGGGNLTSAGGRDAFIARFDHFGDHIGSRSFGASGDQRVTNVARTEASANILFVGTLNDSATIDSTTVSSAGATDVMYGHATVTNPVLTRSSLDSMAAEGDNDSGYVATSPGTPFTLGVSEDARFVAFESLATNLVAGDTNGVRDVFVRDHLTGATTRVSVATGGGEGNGASDQPSISHDGRYVAFRSVATNLIGTDTNGVADIFVHDRQTGTTLRVSVRSDGSQSPSASDWPQISGNGQFVVFQSPDRLISTGEPVGGNDADIFRRDIVNGINVYISRPSGTGSQSTNDGNSQPSVSKDGRYVAFRGRSTNLIGAGNDLNGRPDVFVRDAVNNTTERVSLTTAGAEATGGDSERPFISSDGRYVVFESQAQIDGAGDTTLRDIYLRDRVAATTERLSLDSAAVAGSSSSLSAVVSANGRWVVFASDASNFVPSGGDSNAARDVFLRDRTTATTVRISVDSDGNQVAQASGIPFISDDGRFIGFTSLGALVGTDTNTRYDVYLAPRP